MGIGSPEQPDLIQSGPVTGKGEAASATGMMGSAFVMSIGF